MRQIVILASLLAILVATAQLGARVQSGEAFDATTLTTTGFILLAAYALGELFRRMRLPALLGYLAAGMVFGPSLASIVFGTPAAAPIDQAALEQLGLVNMLAVGVIGTMGGGEIRMADLRENFRKIASITVLVFVMVLPAITGIILGLAFFAPTLVPFLADVPPEAAIAAAILFGALAVGMSPSATLALLLEVRAQGRFTSLVLGIVVLADLVLVATFLLALALGKLLVSTEGFSADRLMEVLPQIGAEFGWAILLGILVGLAFILYLRLVGREVLLFSLGIVFITSFVASRLHAETLLAFLVGGFVVQNFSRHGHELIEAFERIALPVFVIYFTTQAANLDLVSFTVYLPLTLILVTTRITLFYLAIGAAARLARVDDKQRNLLRVSFFSQGGVDLVLAAMVAQAIPAWGAEVQTVTVATILIYIIVGPPLLARALDQAGESAAARERGAETLQARRVRTEAPSRGATFAELRTGDLALDRRMLSLRTLVTSVHESLVEKTILARARTRRAAIDELAATITAALDPDALETDDGALDLDALRRRLDNLHADVTRAALVWTEPDVVPIEAEALQDAFDRLATAERFGSVYRVRREPGLFEPRGTRWQRLVRFFRRVRRAMLGPGMRTVPVGRLWRYHVALDVPVTFWSGIPADDTGTWTALVRHYRVTWRALDDLIAGRRPAPDRGAARSMSSGHASASHDGMDRSSDGEAEATQLEQLAGAHESALEREHALVGQLAERDAALERELEVALADAWQAFVSSVEVAGTLEHPAWRYRVSARYDAAQAATAELRERLERDLRACAGTRDAASALAHASHLARRARAASEEAIARLARDCAAVGPELEVALTLCPAVGAEVPEGEEDPAARQSTMLGQTAQRLDRTARMLEGAESFRARRTGLSSALASVPDTLAPSPLTLAEVVERGDKRIAIRLRAWLDHLVTREITVAILDVQAETGRRIAAVAVSLQHARQVLEYHLVTAQSGGEEIDKSLGERMATLIERARTDLDDAARLAGEQLRARVSKAIDAGVPAVVEGRWDEIQRRLRRLDEGAVSRAAFTMFLRNRVRGGIRRMRKSIRHFRDEVAAVFVERTTPDAVAAYRRLLFGPRSTMSEAYQRLFTSVPAESVGLVHERPEAAAVLAGVERWLEGRGGPILVRGDRGVGKRTLIRQVLGSIGDRMDTHWLALSPHLEREQDVTRTLAEALGWPKAEELATLGRTRPRLARNGNPTAVVVANVERLFRRTPTGLDRIRHFFDLVAATSDEVLWIVLFTEPAARLLGPVLELDGRFPVTITLAPLEADHLERVLTMRHRLSGYELRFAHHSPSLHEWIRHPGEAWRTRRHADSAMYERLQLLSGGNVRQALRLWLAAARIDTHDEGRVVIGPLDAMPDDLLDGLPLVSKVLLAALLLHGALHRDELSEVALREGHGFDAEITHLVHLGFIALEPGPRGRSDPLITVRTRLIAPLTRELRACNLL